MGGDRAATPACPCSLLSLSLITHSLTHPLTRSPIRPPLAFDSTRDTQARRSRCERAHTRCDFLSSPFFSSFIAFCEKETGTWALGWAHLRRCGGWDNEMHIVLFWFYFGFLRHLFRHLFRLVVRARGPCSTLLIAGAAHERRERKKGSGPPVGPWVKYEQRVVWSRIDELSTYTHAQQILFGFFRRPNSIFRFEPGA